MTFVLFGAAVTSWIAVIFVHRTGTKFTAWYLRDGEELDSESASTIRLTSIYLVGVGALASSLLTGIWLHRDFDLSLQWTTCSIFAACAAFYLLYRCFNASNSTRPQTERLS